jgi:V-type H+-transporting ATPase subunit e
MLTLTGCYLLWMITYLAQLHPLIGERILAAVVEQILTNLL